MKFDYIIGNPPYQEETENNGRQKPLYNLFMDSVFSLSDCVELITPARFLFDAGQTPKEWNRKMLSDPHFTVLHYEQNAASVFPNTEIKGGVAISMRNAKADFGKIGIFTKFDELNSILQKAKTNHTIADIMTGAVPYHFSQILKEEHGELLGVIGESFDLRTNIIDKLINVLFFENRPSDGDYVQILGLLNKKRAYVWVDRRYITTPSNFTSYKVFLSKANGAGEFGETLSKMEIGFPKVGHTQSIVSVGSFETEIEALNLEKYIKSKFCRCMLSVLKSTQDITPSKWKYVPLQDFTPNSDIDWSQSVADIDQQLYCKYGLDETEIAFIESHVKEMA